MEGNRKINPRTRFEVAAQLIESAQRIVALTGAGASTDSGIPDYRGIGISYWNKYDPGDFVFERFLSSEDARMEYWRMDQEFYELIKNTQPNQIHRALVSLERMGKLRAIITQNVDGLHQKAGSSPDRVLEIHGNIFTVSCLNCHKKYPREEIYKRIKSGVAVPYCSFCDGILKSDTILFGQPMLQEVSAHALMATLQSDLFVVIGSSLLVQPASYLVMKAREAGAELMIINLTSTPYDIYADLVLYDNAEWAITQILKSVLGDAPANFLPRS